MIGLLLGWVSLLLIIGLDLNYPINGFMIIPLACFAFDIGTFVGMKLNE